jgi:hypothetical protein
MAEAPATQAVPTNAERFTTAKLRRKHRTEATEVTERDLDWLRLQRRHRPCHERLNAECLNAEH